MGKKRTREDGPPAAAGVDKMDQGSDGGDDEARPMLHAPRGGRPAR